MTITTALDVYNAALQACHAKGRLSSLSENKKERYVCDQWYNLTLQTVQEAVHWPSCKATSVLAGKVTRDFSDDWVNTDPEPQFKYSYNLPANCLRPRYLTNYDRFSLGLDDDFDAMKLSTNTDDAVLVYTVLQENVSLWSPGQLQATIYGLAMHIAGPITGRGELINKNMNLANGFLADAQASVLNSFDIRTDYIPDVLQARGYTGPDMNARYLYPFGSFFSAAITVA